ncbi:MAG: hypothetical protein AAF543_12890 [Pseudomonadota bacterium]
MAEHRGRVVEIGGGENQGGAGGADRRGPGLETRAGLWRQAGRIETELVVQPAIAGGIGALRMLLDLVVGRRTEKGAECRIEFGVGIGLAAFG